MTHTQMAPEYVAASKKQCPLSVPLAVLGEVDTPEFDALTVALEFGQDWPDDSDVDSRDDITIDRGEIHFSDAPRPEEETDSEDGPHIEPVPPFVTGTGAIIAGTCSVIILIVVGILFVASHFGGVA